MLTMVATNIPPVADTRDSCSPIKDQGSEGSCTAHAGTSANEWIHRRYLGNKTVVFSPQYTYAKELIANGVFPQDNGSDGTTLCSTLIANGCCELDKFPYIPGTITLPTAEQDANAALYSLGAFHGLVSSQVVLSILGDKTPWPVAIGFDVLESFESNQVAQTGIYNPQAGERSLGGHEVLIVGYDVGVVPTLRPKDCPSAVLIQNSWGVGWGLQGFFWMVLSILDSSDTDLKIVHSGKPW
jgi:hypothetical protein